jgi:ADP-heptose:LPS heptosyltransferase
VIPLSVYLKWKLIFLHKILIIKLSAIGDVLVTSPLFRLLASNHEVHHLVMSHCSSVTLNNPAISKHHVVNLIPSGNRWIDTYCVLRLILNLRAEKYQAAFVLHRNIVFQIICWLAGIKKIYGFTSRLNLFLTQRIDYRFDVNRTLQECALLRIAGYEIENPEFLEFYPSIEALPMRILTILPNNFIACNPGGGNPHSSADNRIWPTEYFAELINRSPLPFVILGSGQHDQERVIKLNKLVKPTKMINLVGGTSLSETALILRRASLYIGNDSSLIFLSAAMKVKTIGLYGPTQVEAANPIGMGHFVITGKTPCSPCYNPYHGVNGKMYTCTNNICMKAINVETVLHKIKEVLIGKVGAI